MSDSTDRQKLLNDVLGEETDAAFREALLHQTLRLARRRRHFRQVQKGAVALLVLGAFALVVWRNLPPGSEALRPHKPYALVRTQTLPASAIVQTKALLPSQVVGSFAASTVVSTTRAADHGLRELTDDELLSLVSPQSAVLVRQAPHMAELVFVNPADGQSLQR